MECSDAQRLIALSHHGPLEDREGQRLDAHLGGCSTCRRLARQHRELDGLLDLLPAAEPPAELVARIMAQARAESTSQALHRRRAAATRSLLALAASMVLAVGLWFVGGTRQSTSSDAPTVPGQLLAPLARSASRAGSAVSEHDTPDLDRRLYARVVSEINWEPEGGRAASEIRFWVGSHQ